MIHDLYCFFHINFSDIYIFQLGEMWKIEDNQLVIFYMKNISRGCVVRR